MASTSLQNINWLSKEVWTKGKKCLLSQTNTSLYFLERQVHKNSKLRIMTNVGKTRVVKVIFTNIHKIRDASANSFSRYIMIAQCMTNVFTLYYINSSLSGKMVFLRKLKLIYHSNPQHYNNCSSPTFLILFKKIVSPTPI